MNLRLCCPITWGTARTECAAYGAPSLHGCKHEPGHNGIHLCPCGAHKNQTSDDDGSAET